MSENKQKVNRCRKVMKWDTVESRVVFSADPWVKVHIDVVRLPAGRIVDDYFRVELPEYVMIYAQREDGKVLIERMYKHAIGDVSLVLPTGCIEKDEDPLDAAKRELLEETGYKADIWNYVGSFVVDGNKGSGKGYFYCAEELERVSDPVEDDMEIAEIEFVEPATAVETMLKTKTSELASTALIALASNPHMKKFMVERENI